MISTYSFPRNTVLEPSAKVFVHLFIRWPPSSYVAIVPNIISMKMNKTRTSNMIGNEFRMVDTKLDMFGMELIVLRGLNSLTTLMAVKPSPCISFSSI